MADQYDEIQVYDNVAERTGNLVARAAVRGRQGVCRSVTDLVSKSRRLGDGYYYLVASAWPEEKSSMNLGIDWEPLG